tara:strand:- start:1254 stop:1802 length:549 start_codon:yes stop_codon:yes gene_type:complete
MNSVFRSIIVLLITILLQLVIFRFGIFGGGKALIFFHLYGIVLLPMGWNKTSYLFIGAFTGIILDIFLVTGGLHMAAGAFLGFLLPKLSNFIAPRDGFLKGHIIGALKDGWIRFLSYCLLISIVYSIILFAVEAGRIGLVFYSIWKGLLSSTLSVILMGVVQGLFGLKRKNKKSKVSAYPWS